MRKVMHEFAEAVNFGVAAFPRFDVILCMSIIHKLSILNITKRTYSGRLDHNH